MTSTQVRRLAHGGLIDRSAPVEFTVDGVACHGYRGDTIASAMLANGIARVGDSIYLGRPRGIVAAGVEEPNALIRVKNGYAESMLAATCVEAVNGLDVSLLSGIGVLDQSQDPAEYDAMNLHVDVAVVGAGPAGLAAAHQAAATGARVVVFEQDFELGGSLLSRPDEHLDGVAALDWLATVRAELQEAPEVRILKRTTVFGSYDGNYLTAVERRGDQFGTPIPGTSRQRVWHVRAVEVVLATGAIERPVIFEGSDLPGVMLASAVQTYLKRYAVLPIAARPTEDRPSRALIFTTNDSAYATAHALHDAGARVAVIDARPDSDPSAAREAARSAGITVRSGSAVAAVDGEGRVESAWVVDLDESGQPTGDFDQVPADLICVAGGWNPTVHLHSQRQGATVWDETVAAFVPEAPVANQRLVGAVTGMRGDDVGVTRALWLVPGRTASLTDHVVDQQRDQTAADVLRATAAGMRSVEHVKRYTSIGTGADQGKLSGVSTIGILASLAGADSPGSIGTTAFRAPFTPVAFGALAGRCRGELFEVARTTAAHPWHVAQGAVFEDVGQWKRPRYYPQGTEDMDAAVARECRAAREGVAFMDATTLGKVEIKGSDASEFLNRIYTNAFAKLAVGKARYGVMCTPDGMVFDDGVSLRLADDRYLMTTTTGGAAKVLDWLEEWLQTEWPELDVTCTSVTEQWSTTAIVGPKSREVVARLMPDLDVSREAFEFMDFRDATLASGIPARVCRISFSGELAFEINVATWYGLKVWEDVAAAGADLGITPYGTETMHVLRAEKAFPIVGQDTDGTVTPHDLGMSWVVSKAKDFIGKRSYSRPSHEGVRKELVSLLPDDPTLQLPEGAQIVASGALGDFDGTGLPTSPIRMEGHVTSSYYSQALGRGFALALVKDGRNRIGEKVIASFGGEFAECEINEQVLFDKEGARRDG